MYIESRVIISFQISNFKFKIPRQRHGYSLVELVVVMGIIAVLMLLSASAFIVVRDQAAADQTAEELLTTFREAQNKAISISKDRAGNDTKVWGVSVANNNFSLNSLYPDGADLAIIAEKNDLNPQPTTIRIIRNSVEITGPVYINYNTPFGRAYVSTSACTWNQSDRPTMEWEATGACGLLSTGESISFEVDKNGKTATVTVAANGEAKIE